MAKKRHRKSKTSCSDGGACVAGGEGREGTPTIKNKNDTANASFRSGPMVSDSEEIAHLTLHRNPLRNKGVVTILIECGN